jgi:hypothetical protein
LNIKHSLKCFKLFKISSINIFFIRDYFSRSRIRSRIRILSQRYGSAIPDPFQNVTDLEHWSQVFKMHQLCSFAQMTYFFGKIPKTNQTFIIILFILIHPLQSRPRFVSTFNENPGRCWLLVVFNLTNRL